VGDDHCRTAREHGENTRKGSRKRRMKGMGEYIIGEGI